MRTLGLVSLGSAMVVLVGSSYGDLHFQQDAASRVIQGILTGLGFLGAGVIMREEDKLEVHGLTTAATVIIAASSESPRVSAPGFSPSPGPPWR